MSVKLLSEKTSCKTGPNFLQIIVRGKIERWKEAVLSAWVLAWIFCGGIVINEYLLSTSREQKMIFLIFLVFWAYYLWRVGKTFLFRIGGNELIKVEGNMLYLKRSIFTYGKTREFFLENIQEFEPIKLSKTSFAYTFENSWWVMGGEKLGFQYQGKLVKFGMQIPPETVNKLYPMIKKQIKANIKSAV